MPNYLRTVAKNRNDALIQIEKKLGHKDITILREGNINHKKRRWFRTVNEKVYYIECVEYRNRLNIRKTPIKPQPTVTLNANLANINKEKVVNSLNPLDALVASINQREKNVILPSFSNPIQVNETNSCKLSEPSSTPSRNLSRKSNFISHSITKKSAKGISNIHDFKGVYNFLINREFTQSFAKKITDYFDLNELNNNDDYYRLADHISSFFKFSGIVKTKNDQPHYVFVLGPTGVGKTTTLSKIASSFYTDENHYPKPSMIKFASLDAKRIMAMEQLRKFANILRLPFQSIYGVDDFKKLYKQSKKKELILIDTSGVSKQDTDLIDEIAVFTRSLKSSKEIHLCLSASSRYFDLKKIYQVLSKTKPDRILITKIDESYSLGSVLSFIDEEGIPISYITNGQDVPIDILSANPEQIKSILLKEWGL